MFREELNISNTGFESEFSNFLSKKELIDKKIIAQINKNADDDLSGIPLRSLIRARPVKN